MRLAPLALLASAVAKNITILQVKSSLHKQFKSAETVNVKFGVYEFGDKGGNKFRVMGSLSVPPSFHPLL